MRTAEILDKRTVLSQHFLFGQLESDQLDRVLALAVERDFRNGAVIFYKGEEGTSMMTLLRGQVRISAFSEDGREIILNSIEPGGFFGEIALIDGKKRSANATAVGQCTLLLINRRDFIPFLKQNPEIAIRLLTVVCERLRYTSEIAETVAFLTIPARLARLLMKIAETQGVETADGLHIDLKLSQREMGNFIAASRESVNKQLRAWQAQGLIAMEQGDITILQPDILEDLTESAF